MKKRVILFLVLLFSFGFVNASTTFKVDCPTKATALEVIKCTVSIKPDNYGLDGLSFNYDITGGTYDSFTPNGNYSKLSITQYGAMLNRETTYTGTNFDTVGTLAVKMPSSGSISIVFNNISIITSDRDELSASSVTKTIKLADNNNYLSSISVSEGTLSPTFNKNTTSYTVTNVNSDSINITAKSEVSTASVSGTGTKTLKYGANDFTITVSAENGIKKTYNIKVYRNDNRDKTNTLSSLSIDGYDLSPSFDKNTTSYTLKVKKDVTSVKINATLESSKSSFVKNYGPRTVNLNYGENTIQIQVKSEAEGIKKYTIKVTREDNRSNNNFLKSLNVSAGDFKFNKSTLSYSFSVPNETTSIKVVATPEDAKSKVDGAKTYNLKEGNNKITITVTAENGSVKKYILQVTRIAKVIKKDVNLKLDNIEIDNYQINFDPETTIYNITIDDETELKINFKTQDETSAAIINGNNDLKNGSVIKITVTGIDGSTKDYLINISKNEKVNTDDNNQSGDNNNNTSNDNKDNNKNDNKVVKLNRNRKLQIIIGVASFIVIVISIILIVIINVKKSIKKSAALWK